MRGLVAEHQRSVVDRCLGGSRAARELRSTLTRVTRATCRLSCSKDWCVDLPAAKPGPSWPRDLAHVVETLLAVQLRYPENVIIRKASFIIRRQPRTV